MEELKDKKRILTHFKLNDIIYFFGITANLVGN